MKYLPRGVREGVKIARCFAHEVLVVTARTQDSSWCHAVRSWCLVRACPIAGSPLSCVNVSHVGTQSHSIALHEICNITRSALTNHYYENNTSVPKMVNIIIYSYLFQYVEIIN